MKKVVLAGGTGFLGKYLASKFRDHGAQVIVVSRSGGHVRWSDKEKLIEALEDSDIVVNLAGKSVDCRYNERNRNAILSSRTETTQLIGEAIQACQKPPRLWINSSTATIYRHAEDRPMTEGGGEIGSGFSVDVATKWEETFFGFQLQNTRQVAFRMAIVLGKHGGVMVPLKRLVKLGLGGKQGRGNQMFSWIHIEDIYQIILFVMTHKEIDGVINCSSPNPVTNLAFMQALRKELRVSIGLPSPQWLLEIGAVIIRTETELILKSRWVLPERLLAAGYTFVYPTLSSALENVLATQKE